MIYIVWLLRILVLVFLIAFALKNVDPVVVRFYLGIAWEAPLVLVLLIVFVLGAVVGVLASLGPALRKRREIVGLRKQIRSLTPEDTR